MRGTPNTPADYNLPPVVMKAEEVTPSKVMSFDYAKFWAGDPRVTLASDKPDDKTDKKTKGNQGTITRVMKFRAKFKDVAHVEAFEGFLARVRKEMEAAGAKVGETEGPAPSLGPQKGDAGDKQPPAYRAMAYTFEGRSCAIRVTTAGSDKAADTEREVTVAIEEMMFKHR